MKKCGLLILILFAQSCYAQTKGLKQVKIVVEDLNEQTQSTGLSESEIKSVVLVALKRDMPKLQVSSDAVSYVYVNINCLSVPPSGRVCNLIVDLHRPVMVLDEDGSPIQRDMTAVWTRSMLLTNEVSAMGQSLRDSINRLLTMLAADYYSENQ
ncbi:MAG TPA: hypothetical protein VKD70_07330 [Candidatus Acidoferrum sp.]|nr:hypothetical protein [Candidatus Acidoferrum sp.]